VSVTRAAAALQSAPRLLGIPVILNVPAMLIVLLITAVLVRGIRESARLNSAMVILKLAIIVFFLGFGAFFVRPENLQVAAWPEAGDFARMSLILVFAFAGIEVALIPSGEVRDPERTVPKAIALAMVGVTILYIALQVVAQQEQIDAELDAATDLDSAADLDAEPKMPKAQTEESGELDDIELDDAEPAKQAEATPTPAPEAADPPMMSAVLAIERCGAVSSTVR
jgi:hypothetical protein